MKRFVACSVLVAGIVAQSTPVRADTFSISAPTQLSVAKEGVAVNGPSTLSVAPANKDLAVFQSTASNLNFAQQDTNVASDIFQFDPSTSPALSRQNLTDAGEEAAHGGRLTFTDNFPFTFAGSVEPAVSSVLADGKYGIAFSSDAENLLSSGLPPELVGVRQVYLRLPFLGKTVLISRDSNGGAGNGDSYRPTVVAQAGSKPVFKVVFASRAGNLGTASDPSAEFLGLFLATVTVNSSTDISVIVQPLFSSVSGDFDEPKLSGDGSFLAFVSDAPGLIPGQSVSGLQVYRYDLTKLGIATPTLLSQNAGTAGGGASYLPSISYTGNAVVFTTEATNLGVNASVSGPKVVLFRDGASSLTLISKNAAGEPSNGLYDFNEGERLRGAISSNGRLVVFEDTGTNLVTPATSGRRQVYAKDLDDSTGAVQLVSKTASGVEADAASFFPFIGGKSFAGSGGYILFSTAATNLGFADGGNTVARVFRSVVDFPDPPLTSGAKIQTPPDVKVTNRRVTFVLQRFSLNSASSAKFSSASTSDANFGAAATTITYRLSLRGSRTKARITRISRRNKITIRKLRPDTYRARYRAVRKSSSGRPAVTRTSPTRVFTIR